MKKRLMAGAAVFVTAFAAAQFVRPDRANPATDPGRTIRAHASAVATVVDRSCRDCHSNETVWPWYTRVAPVSWLMAYGVTKGRAAVNFSEWGAYPPDVQRMLLDASCQDVSAGKMPGVYALLQPETKLTSQDIQTICAAARQMEPHAARVSR